MITTEEIKAAFPKFEWEQYRSDEKETTWHGTANEGEDDQVDIVVTRYARSGVISIEVEEVTGDGFTLDTAKRDLEKDLNERYLAIRRATDLV